MKTQPMRAAYLAQMSLLKRRADLLPRIASQSHFESMRSFLTILAREPCGRLARLEPVNNLMACAAYLGREHPGQEYLKPRKSNEMTHCHDMVRKTESLPKRDFTPDKACCSRSA